MRRTITGLILTLSLCVPALAQAGEGALDSFRSAQERVLALVAAGAKEAKVEAEVDQLLDYDWLAKAALGGPTHYAERCAERCEEFELLLEQLIRTNYLSRLAEAERGRVEYLGEQVGSTATKVDTRVSFQAGDKLRSLDVDYVMHEVEGRWQVRDIITEDVSLAKNYRYEINQLYRKGGIDAVITALETRLEQLR